MAGSFSSGPNVHSRFSRLHAPASSAPWNGNALTLASVSFNRPLRRADSDLFLRRGVPERNRDQRHYTLRQCRSKCRQNSSRRCSTEMESMAKPLHSIHEGFTGKVDDCCATQQKNDSDDNQRSAPGARRSKTNDVPQRARPGMHGSVISLAKPRSGHLRHGACAKYVDEGPSHCVRATTPPGRG